MAITPPVSDNILEGITRRTIMLLLKDELGIDVVERRVDRTELFLADEVFFSGTGVQLSAVTKIDHRVIGSGSMGPVVKQLREIFFNVVRGRMVKYRHWCMPVYHRGGNGSSSGRLEVAGTTRGKEIDSSRGGRLAKRGHDGVPLFCWVRPAWRTPWRCKSSQKPGLTGGSLEILAENIGELILPATLRRSRSPSCEESSGPAAAGERVHRSMALLIPALTGFSPEALGTAESCRPLG